MSKRRIGILGGGIIGAATALELVSSDQAQELEVTVFDAGAKAPQATPGSLGWINAHSPRDEDYFRLRVESIGLWHALLAAHPALPIRFAGTLDWDMDEASLAPNAASFTALGHPTQMLDQAELSRHAPFLATPPKAALSLSAEGFAIPTEIAPALRRLAIAKGARFVPTEVLEIHHQSNKITGLKLSSGDVELDGLISTAGASIASLLAPLGLTIPMRRAPGMLVTTKPLPFITDKVIAAPGIHFWQHDTGTVLMGADFGGGDTGPETATLLCQRLQSLCALPQTPEVQAITIADRPIPSDGKPILDASPMHQNLWFGVMHSGVTLAPVAAKRLAGMALGQLPSNSAAAFKLNRFD